MSNKLKIKILDDETSKNKYISINNINIHTNINTNIHTNIIKEYNDQAKYPHNKIISYLETRKNYKLRILDLGCGENLIKQHFKLDSKLNIIGYYSEKNHNLNNLSKIADIGKLDEESDLIDICIYNQSLIGLKWKEYMAEGKRVLRCNGNMIISDLVAKLKMVKEYLAILEMKIINEENISTNKWFYINAIKDH